MGRVPLPSVTLPFLLACLSTAGCSQDGGSRSAASTASPLTSSSAAATTSSSAAALTTHITGTFRALTYNVAGLPMGLSSSAPQVNIPQISPKLNQYDLVLVQEDFAFHVELQRDALHPFQSLPLSHVTTLVNDGLNRFSQSPFIDFHRTRWSTCHGVTGSANDCLASKGFSAARHEVGPGVVIDVYNLHADAGRDSGDIDARRVQFDQLAAFIPYYSGNGAVIVCGDTNLQATEPRDEQILLDFLARTGLQDVARTLGAPEMIDRFFFRSGPDVIIAPLRWRIAAEFIDSSGNPLSDHEAIHVDFEWRHR